MFKELSNNVQTLITRLPQIVADVIVDNNNQVIDYNTAQLEEGKQSTGDNMPLYASNSYAQFKKSIGSKSSPRTDLKVTGDFYSGFYVKKSGQNLIFGSSDSKATELEAKYGKDIYGISINKTDDIKSIVINDIKIKVNEILRR